MRKRFPILRAGFPAIRAGQSVGLLGGSFDPPHAGHVHVTREALKRFGLDRIWWLVSPGNPLKPVGPAPLERRMEVARRMMRHPRVMISDIEAKIGTRYTADTLSVLVERFPGVRFVWLMGADNLLLIHHWQQWCRIFQTVPVGIVARSVDVAAARHAKAATTFANVRLQNHQSLLLPRTSAPAWCLVNVPMLDVSSSAIRARGEWMRSASSL